MQEVSQAYRESMKEKLRNQSYIKINLGIINQEAQNNAEIADKSGHNYFSQYDIFGTPDTSQIYATYETNFGKVDGSMYFPPKPGGSFFYNGIVSNTMGGSLKILFNALPLDIKGLTIDFGDTYPTKFSIVTDTETVTYENDKRVFETEDTFREITYLHIVTEEMRYPDNRLRVYSIQFGLGLVFDGKIIKEATMDDYCSPITENIPQIDLTLILINKDKAYNVDNEDSFINFLETGQECQIYYGYDLGGGNIEWLQGNSLKAHTWNANDEEVTITCVDTLRLLTGNYYKDTMHENGITLFQLAINVLTDAGVEPEMYFVDESLKDIIIYNPLPNVPCKSALQIIANAGCCSLRQDRKGVIRLEPADTLGIETDFEIDYGDMLENPLGQQCEKISEVKVYRTTYSKSTQLEQLVTETLIVTNEQTEIFYFNSPVYNLSCGLSNAASGQTVRILSQGAYYVEVIFEGFSSETNVEFYVNGYTYIRSQAITTNKINNRGLTKEWTNPLISTVAQAQRLAQWLGNYYRADKEYSYTYRGNPELDTNDIIKQENLYVPNMRVNVLQNKITYNGGISGKIRTRRMG